MPFVDIHNHIIPHVDDGAEDWATSLEMLRVAQADGIVELVATPHVKSVTDLQKDNKFASRFAEVERRAVDTGITLKLNLGAELLVQPGYDYSRHMATLAGNGRYVLMEFPWRGTPDDLREGFFGLLPGEYTPIIGHPERNPAIIADPSLAVASHAGGALLQVTSGSLLGDFGNDVRSVADFLMEHDLVHVIATDAHDVHSRPLKLGDAHDYVADRWGDQRAEALLFENPNSVIRGRSIQKHTD